MIVIDWSYISLSRDERRSHLDFQQPCLERGGKSTHHKGVLAGYLGTSIPGTLPEGRVCLCHACHNGKCSNPRHLYWGTDKDNFQDQIENGTAQNPYARTVSKYGLEYALSKARKGAETVKEKAQLKRLASPAPEPKKKGLPEEEIQRRLDLLKSIDLGTYGWVEKAANLIGISHTQVRRFVIKYYEGDYLTKAPNT